MNNCTQMFTLSFIAMFFVNLGIFMSLLLFKQGSLKEQLDFVGLPIYQSLFLFSFCLVGQHLDDAVRFGCGV